MPLTVRTSAARTRPRRASPPRKALRHRQVTVPASSGPGFNDGIVCYPTDTSQGTFGAIAVMPGFVSPEGSIEWYGPRLASQGFVVFRLDSNNPFDFPGARRDQFLAALDYLTTKSSVTPDRLAVMDWSMGGGGSLEAAVLRPALKAAIGLARRSSRSPHRA